MKRDRWTANGKGREKVKRSGRGDRETDYNGQIDLGGRLSCLRDSSLMRQILETEVARSPARRVLDADGEEEDGGTKVEDTA